MMKPKAKLIPSRSASVTAGTALPARVRVAITEPGPTRTRAAVPRTSARKRCRIEYMAVEPPSLILTAVRHCRIGFANRSARQGLCQEATMEVTPGSWRPHVDRPGGLSAPHYWRRLELAPETIRMTPAKP